MWVLELHRDASDDGGKAFDNDVDGGGASIRRRRGETTTVGWLRRCRCRPEGDEDDDEDDHQETRDDDWRDCVGTFGTVDDGGVVFVSVFVVDDDDEREETR